MRTGSDPYKVPRSLEKSQLKYQLKRTFTLYINSICNHIVITAYHYLYKAFNLYLDASLEYLGYCDSALTETKSHIHVSIHIPIICSCMHKYSNYSIEIKSNTE